MTNEPDGDAGDVRESSRDEPHDPMRAGVTRVTSIGVSPVETSPEAGGDAGMQASGAPTEQGADADADRDATREARRDAGRHLDRTVLLTRPRDSWARVRVEGMMAAAVAASATGGALVAFGLREGGALDAFTGAGRRMLDIAATEGGAASLRALLAGLGAHLLVCLLWGFVFAALAARRRPWRAALTALLLAGAVYSASDLWLPAVLRLGYGLYATRPQHLLLHLMLAGGLWVGTRLAQYGPRNA